MLRPAHFLLSSKQFNFGFGGMGGMGGGGGGGGAARRASQPREVNNKKFYETLEVAKDASETDIKKAFRRQAMVHHPDKGGDPEKFKELQRAYEVLTDKDKRAIYDEHGEEGLESGGPRGGGDDMDIFDLFGGGGGRRQGGGAREKRKGQTAMFPLELTLEEMYNGTTKKLRLTRNALCKGCKGKGGKSSKTCTDCRGQGVRVVMRQIGPGMLTQSQHQCPACNGEGTIVPAADRCGDCQGNKLEKEKKNLDVVIPRGARTGQKQVFTGAGDEGPDVLPGDVEVVFSEKKHARFVREGNHLFMKRRITLLEALTGFKFDIQHLDGRVLVVTHAGGPVKPGDVKRVPDEGMPSNGSIHNMGNLYIEFDVDFPAAHQITPDVRRVLAAALPAPAPYVPVAPVARVGGTAEDPEDAFLEDVDMTQERARFDSEKRAEREAEEDDRDSRHGHGPRMQAGPGCQQA